MTIWALLDIMGKQYEYVVIKFIEFINNFWLFEKFLLNKSAALVTRQAWFSFLAFLRWGQTNSFLTKTVSIFPFSNLIFSQSLSNKNTHILQRKIYLIKKNVWKYVSEETAKTRNWATCLDFQCPFTTSFANTYRMRLDFLFIFSCKCNTYICFDLWPICI